MEKDFAIIVLIAVGILFLVLRYLYKNPINNKTSNNKKIDGEYIKDNYDTLINYWSAIVSGDENLKNGKKFDSQGVYSPKLLKYELNHLKLAVIVRGHQAWKQNNKELLSAASVCYMFLANFLDDIPEDFENEQLKFNELVMSYTNTENKNEDEDIEDLAKKIASMDSDKMSEANNMLTKRQLEFSNHFTTSIKKFVNKNQK